MSKDPAILFYTADFLIGTEFFTDEQCGKYIRALCKQHQHGHLTENQLNQIINNDTYVKDKFKTDENGLFFNDRMEIEINKRKKYSESRRKNVMIRYHEKDKPLINKKVKHHTYESTYDLHMENENEDENEDKNINGKKSDSDVKNIPTQDFLKQAMEGFIENRKGLRKPLGDNARSLIIEKLEKLYPGDQTRQIECLNQSTENGWQGVFKLKAEQIPRPQYGRQEVSMDEIKDQFRRVDLS